MSTKYKMVQAEIEAYLQDWRYNKDRTPNQKVMYHYNRINKDMLGIGTSPSGNDCIRLLTEDGWDGDYVGSVSPTTARQYWWDQEHRVRPKTRDLIRMGFFFHIDFYRTLILVMKKEWEVFLFTRLLEDGKDNGMKEMPLIESYTDTQKYLIEFAANIEMLVDIDEIYDVFNAHNRYALNNGFSRAMFKSLVRYIVAEKLQRHALNSEEINAFIEKWEKEKNTIEKDDEKIQACYLNIKQEWMNLRNSVEQSIMMQDEIRGRIHLTRVAWAKMFGELEIRLEEIKNESNKLSKMINIKEGAQNEDLTYDEVEARAIETMSEERRTLEKEREEIRRLLSCARINEQKEVLARIFNRGISLSDQIKTSGEIKEMYRQMYIKIYKKTHPDGAEWGKATELQQRELISLFNRAIETKKNQNLSPAECIPIFDGILNEVNEILEHAGIDIDEFELDETLENTDEMIERLKAKIAALEERDAELKNEIYILLSDDEINRKEAKLANEASIVRERDSIEDKITKLEGQVANKQAQLDALFG